MVKFIKLFSNYAVCWALNASSTSYCWALSASSTGVCWALKPNKNLCF